MGKDNSKAKEIKKKRIDLIDSKMIHLLQKDGRIPNTEIAKKLEISEATVRSRLKRLIDEGFIQIVAVSNPFKLGFEIAGDLYINVEMKKVDNILDKLKKIKELGLNSARFAILTPYPGTPLFKEFEKEGRILTHDWSKYNRKTVVFQPKNMTIEELQNGFFEISKKFNNAPNAIYRSMKGLKLGLYPFLNCTSRNIENYLNRPKKWAR